MRHTLEFTIIIIRFILQFLYIVYMYSNRYAQTCQVILYICDTECIYYTLLFVSWSIFSTEKKRERDREQEHG